MGISLKPETFTTSSFMDDVDATIESARFVMYGFPNKEGVDSCEPRPVLEVKYKYQYEGEEREASDHHGCGQASDWAPSSDGKSLEALTGKLGLSRQSGAAIFLIALKEAGFPTDKLDDDISALDGTEVHLNVRPVPQTARDREEGRKQRTVRVATRINKLPGEKSAAKKAAKKAASSKSSDAISEEELDNVILEILAEGECAKKDLPRKVGAAVEASQKRSAIATCISDGYLTGDRPFTYENGTLSL